MQPTIILSLENGSFFTVTFLNVPNVEHGKTVRTGYNLLHSYRDLVSELQSRNPGCRVLSLEDMLVKCS